MTTNYLYDGPNLLEEVDQSGTVLARYSGTQKVDEPLAELRSGATSYYEADGLGSITSLTGSSGANLVCRQSERLGIGSMQPVLRIEEFLRLIGTCM
jgi:hypothetical protein